MHATRLNTSGLDEDLRSLRGARSAAQRQAERQKHARREARDLVQYLQQDVLQRPEVKTMQTLLAREGRRKALCLFNRPAFHPRSPDLYLTRKSIRVGAYHHRSLRAARFNQCDGPALKRQVEETLARACREGVIKRAERLGPSRAQENAKFTAKVIGVVIVAPVWIPLMVVASLFRRR